MLQDSDDEDDALDEYIYGVLKDSDSKGGNIQEKMDGFQKIFMGSETNINTDESHELIRRLQEENALDAKYEQFAKSRDNDMEERFNALKKDGPTFSNYSSNSGDRPRGAVPKPLQNEDLHDEMDDWCCKVLLKELVSIAEY